MEQASSTAVMYDSLGRYLGTMAKFGPLAHRDSCTDVRGVLERLMTHFCFVVVRIDACMSKSNGVVAGCH